MEKKTPRISIVMPCYNVEDYIDECLNSIFSQSFKDYEIIAVNDSSTDLTLKILNDYEKKYKCLHVYTQKNKGAGAARNYGLTKAVGKFVLFMDSDDFLEPNALQILNDATKKEDVDAYYYNYYRFDHKFHTKTKVQLYKEYTTSFTSKNLTIPYQYIDVESEKINLIRNEVAPWNKLYRKDFILKNDIKFDELYNVNDRTFYYAALLKSKKIIFINSYLINYRTNNIAAETATYNMKKYYDRISAHESSWRYFKEESEDIQKLFFEGACSDFVGFLNRAVPDQKFELFKKTITFINGLKKYLDLNAPKYKFILNSGYLQNVEKLEVEKHEIPFTPVTKSNVDISIIIPCYNQEDYLDDCLKSIFSQSFKRFEVVCVNDGSTDNTLSILKKYKNNYSNLKIIDYKTNKGTSQARKDAALATTGKYVMFVDPDDSINKDTLSFLFEKMEKEQVDMLHFGTNVINCGVDDGLCDWFEKFCGPFENYLYDENIYFSCFEKELFGFNLWNKIYNGNIVRKAFSYVKDGYFPKAQDMYAFALISYFSKSYLGIPEKFYNYKYGTGITGNNDISLSKFKRIATQMHIIELLYKFIDEQNPDNYSRYLIALQNRNDKFFGEIMYSFSHVENLKDNLEECIKALVNGMTPLFQEIDFQNKNVFKSFLSKLDSNIEKLYFNNNCMKDQNIYNWYKNYLISNNLLTLYNDHEKSTLFKSIYLDFNTQQNFSYKNIIPVVFATNDNYVPYLSVTIESIIENSTNENFYDIYVFHTSLNQHLQQKLVSMSTNNVHIRFINVMPYIKNMGDLYTTGHFSIEMYYRLLIAEVLVQYNKVLYLDCDMVVETDIANLYNIDIGNNVFAAVINLLSEDAEYYVKNTLKIDTKKYFNSGMLLINTDSFRSHNIKQKCFDVLSEYKTLRFPDQDILNLSTDGLVLYLDETWNFQVENVHYSLNYKYSKGRNIIHYTSGHKPWNMYNLELGEVFWKYAKNSPFYQQILSTYFSSTLNIHPSNQNHRKNIINNKNHIVHYKTINPIERKNKCALTWPFRILKTFLINWKVQGFKYAWKQNKIKVKYAINRLKGTVDIDNHIIVKKEKK